MKPTYLIGAKGAPDQSFGMRLNPFNSVCPACRHPRPRGASSDNLSPALLPSLPAIIAPPHRPNRRACGSLRRTPPSTRQWAWGPRGGMAYVCGIVVFAPPFKAAEELVALATEHLALAF